MADPVPPEALPSILPHTTHTFTYNEVNGTPVQLDVHLVEPPPKEPTPAVLYFHGGYVITGDRTLVPPWFLNASLKRNWVFVSADFRCLPESTGLDVLADLQSAWHWVSHELSSAMPSVTIDTSRLAVAGASGGGWCALLGATTFADPTPAVAFLTYPMADTAPRERCVPSSPMELPTADAAPTLAEIDARVARGAVSTGHTLAPDFSDLATHPRWPYVRFTLQEGVYVDYLTGIRGAGRAIAAGGGVHAAALPEALQVLFPLDFEGWLGPDTPPLVLSHGVADPAIPVAESERLVRKCREVGARIDYFPAERMVHGFDWLNGDVEDESRDLDVAEAAMSKCLKRVRAYMEK